MSILVDQCVWAHRGRLWCHLISDTSFEELHSFAGQLGLPRVAFQGDHYDLHEHGRQAAISRGALAVDGRVVVKALEAAGLRRGPAYNRNGLSGVQHLPAPELRTQRLILRQWREADREPMHGIDADPVVAKYLGVPMTRQQTDTAINNEAVRLAIRGFGKWAVTTHDGELIGRVGLSVATSLPFGPALEMGWRLAPSAWGHGYATEAARAAMQFGFERLGVDEVIAFTAAVNVPSQRVMQRLAMTTDPADDFDHPKFEPGHPLSRHVLYRARANPEQICEPTKPPEAVK
jgi:RimJ/RimL family protein N-acetyltransferase